MKSIRFLRTKHQLTGSSGALVRPTRRQYSIKWRRSTSRSCGSMSPCVTFHTFQVVSVLLHSEGVTCDTTLTFRTDILFIPLAKKKVVAGAPQNKIRGTNNSTQTMRGSWSSQKKKFSDMTQANCWDTNTLVLTSDTPRRPHNTRYDPTTLQHFWRSDPVSPWRLDHTRGSRQDIHRTRVPITTGRLWLARYHH